ncbi:putative TIM-barrel fold metal-dependent hydrolase [Agromyces flavus]|uniref:TIM-barrel fold metal-dependent hydrolase n=1 Tax=Agromyces flavus TaxID=589382 RepID=A0A1H2A4W8_9MICO|nr:hypothetical protein [Agromyces flavus]MCP2367432.1 putative TIM-barrel fold metal-dependent hydrolase [Agromyces flavus]GGI45742.1 amidohydrolase [Agromyces flavus]SDT40954.1 hypothetical protein SAMN04489721_3510 [Agromyces flavus]
MTAKRGDRERVAEAIERMPLVDHHVHGMLADPLVEAELLDAMLQADQADRTAVFDSQFGFAVRRWCAPALGLEPFADAAEYLVTRSELGFDEATSRILRASGITTYLIDDGHAPERLLPDERMMRLAGARSYPIVRLETLAETAMAGASSGDEFLERLEAALATRAARAVGYKTIAAYRVGLALDPARPTAAEVAAAADAWFAAGAASAQRPRLADATIIRHLAWWALEQGSVLQVHVGFGDGDLRFDRADPFLLQPFLAATQHTGGRVVLLHCYPFVREAGMLAHLYPHVHLDAGLALGQVGANADVVLRESLDLAPFSKVLFSTDAWGAPERVLVGAAAWRDAATGVLADYVDRHDWLADDAIRVAELMAWRNAEALYGRRFVMP